MHERVVKQSINAWSMLHWGERYDKLLLPRLGQLNDTASYTRFVISR